MAFRFLHDTRHFLVFDVGGDIAAEPDNLVNDFVVNLSEQGASD